VVLISTHHIDRQWSVFLNHIFDSVVQAQRA
jgi:hypothetical protein